MATHNGGYVFLLVFLWLTFLATVVIHTIAIFDGANRIGLFALTTMSMETQYTTELTRASWSHYVWVAVYAYQLLWLIYITTTFARLDDEKDFIYIVGPVHFWLFYLLNILGLGQIIAWLFLFMYKLIMPASILSATGFVTILIAFILSVSGLAKHNIDLVKVGLPLEHRLVVGFIHNGLGALLGWMAFNVLDMMMICFQYASNISSVPLMGMATLLTGMGLLVLYAVLDMAFEKHTRFVYTPYMMAILSVVGTFMRGPHVNSYVPITQNNYMLVPAQLALAGLLFLVKIIVSIAKEAKDPAFKNPLEEQSDYGSVE